MFTNDIGSNVFWNILLTQKFKTDYKTSSNLSANHLWNTSKEYKKIYLSFSRTRKLKREHEEKKIEFRICR